MLEISTQPLTIVSDEFIDLNHYAYIQSNSGIALVLTVKVGERMHTKVFVSGVVSDKDIYRYVAPDLMSARYDVCEQRLTRIIAHACVETLIKKKQHNTCAATARDLLLEYISSQLPSSIVSEMLHTDFDSCVPKNIGKLAEKLMNEKCAQHTKELTTSRWRHKDGGVYDVLVCVCVNILGTDTICVVYTSDIDIADNIRASYKQRQTEHANIKANIKLNGVLDSDKIYVRTIAHFSKSFKPEVPNV